MNCVNHVIQLSSWLNVVAGTFGFENMATVALAVNLVTYMNGVMHFDIADAANVVTNFMGTSYILSIGVAFFADTYIGRYKAVIFAACIEFMVRMPLEHIYFRFLWLRNMSLCTTYKLNFYVYMVRIYFRKKKKKLHLVRR